MRAGGHLRTTFEPASFDVVVAANVLHLVPDVRAAVIALRRVLKPGGRLVTPAFCHDQTFVSSAVSRARALTGFPIQRRFTGETLQLELERAGVRTGRQETLPGLIPVGYVEGVFDERRREPGRPELVVERPSGERGPTDASHEGNLVAVLDPVPRSMGHSSSAADDRRRWRTA